MIKITLRILAYPLVLGLILISFNFHAIRKSILFLIYGGEWTTYSKEDAKTIQDIYCELKEQRTTPPNN